jgi:hypothetical protein
MMKRMTHPALVAVVLAAFLLTTYGCGYILYPERRNAVPSKDLDTTVVVYDCLWLLAGVIPGVVAIVIDATNRTWYYPEGHKAALPGDQVLVRVGGAAPTDCVVTLRCIDQTGRDLTPAVRVNAVAGEPLGELAVTVPAAVEPGKATVVLAVNGTEQMHWSVGTNVN